MMKNKIQTVNLRRSLLASAIMAGMGLSTAQAFEVDTGNEDLNVRFDNTVKYNYGVRTESADKTMLATPNSNDGDYNFRRSGTNITNRLDLLTELDVVWKRSMGFRVSAASWYDKAYDNTGSNSNPFVNGGGPTRAAGPTAQVAALTQNPFISPAMLQGGYGSPHLSNYAQRYYSGPSGEILDAFVFYSTDVGEESLLSFKVGQTNVFWGETLLNPVHSLSYGQSGLDLAKLAASPGTEAKELFVPRNQFFSSFTLNSELTLAGQYFFKWDAARLPEAGTFYGGSDVLQEGGQSFLLGSSSTTPGFFAPGTLAAVTHGHDYTPDNSGDWGVMAKWAPEWLDGSLGFYYRQTSDILPQAVLNAQSLTAGAATIGAQGNCGGLGAGSVQLFGGVANCINAQAQGNITNSLAGLNYSLAYAEDIDVFGISLSKSFGGISVGSDLNYRQNMPLSSIAMVVSPELAAGLPLTTPLGTAPAISPRSASTGVVTAIPGNNYSATGDTLHWTLNALTTFADSPMWDSAVLLGELYYSNLISLDNKNQALYKGKSTYHGIDQSTKSNTGIGVNFTPTWYQVFPGVDMSMPLSVDVGIDGTSPVVGGGAEDTGNYAVGVGAVIYNKYLIDLKYVDAFGKTDKCNDASNDGAQPYAFLANEEYACYGGGYSSFSGGGASTEDRGAVYLTLKTTI